MQIEYLADVLAREAKRLQEGMQHRVKRLPDIADFRVAFERVLLEEDDKRTGGLATAPQAAILGGERFNISMADTPTEDRAIEELHQAHMNRLEREARLEKAKEILNGLYGYSTEDRSLRQKDCELLASHLPKQEVHDLDWGNK